jgi:hypothetical protein
MNEVKDKKNEREEEEKRLFFFFFFLALYDKDAQYPYS